MIFAFLSPELVCHSQFLYYFFGYGFTFLKSDIQRMAGFILVYFCSGCYQCDLLSNLFFLNSTRPKLLLNIWPNIRFLLKELLPGHAKNFPATSCISLLIRHSNALDAPDQKFWRKKTEKKFFSLYFIAHHTIPSFTHWIAYISIKT